MTTIQRRIEVVEFAKEIEYAVEMGTALVRYALDPSICDTRSDQAYTLQQALEWFEEAAAACGSRVEDLLDTARE